jgi:hypothetical protein
MRLKALASHPLLLGAILLTWLIFPAQALSRQEHVVYFPNTAYELNIYKIYGKKPGPTLMLIGGIQGNEPGGFLSADLYADMSLEKGNLIVVPRANFYSIITNQRGPNGDMNRKFKHEENEYSMEDKIVTILKKLITGCDYLLNLHDGSGYYYPTYFDKWRNPDRFGQSIIADDEEFRVPGKNKVIKLGEMARRICKQVNSQIKNDLYQFHFMNTRTDEPDSPHSEQLGSATYYALTRHYIPAFGVETSKFLPSVDLKVEYHNLVINAFMKIFGIIPESPGLNLDPPCLKYLVVAINGQRPVLLEPGQVLELLPGDSLNVTHIEANYERGLSLDILGCGGINDFRKNFNIFKDTSIVVRKDNESFAEIAVKVSNRGPEEKTREASPRGVDYFVIEAKSHRLLVANGEALPLVRGDKLKILEILPRASDSSGIKVNFKGFVGDPSNNTGEDRGYVINTGTDLIERFSLDGKGTSYEILASRGDHILGRMVVNLLPPQLDYLILRVNGSGHHLVMPKDKVAVSRNDTICLEKISTNLFSDEGIHLKINGYTLQPGEEKAVKDLLSSAKHGEQDGIIEKGSLTLGMIKLQVR